MPINVRIADQMNQPLTAPPLDGATPIADSHPKSRAVKARSPN